MCLPRGWSTPTRWPRNGGPHVVSTNTYVVVSSSGCSSWIIFVPRPGSRALVCPPGTVRKPTCCRVLSRRPPLRRLDYPAAQLGGGSSWPCLPCWRIPLQKTASYYLGFDQPRRQQRGSHPGTQTRAPETRLAVPRAFGAPWGPPLPLPGLESARALPPHGAGRRALRRTGNHREIGFLSSALGPGRAA